MKHFDVRPYAVSACAAVALVAGCGGSDHAIMGAAPSQISAIIRSDTSARYNASSPSSYVTLYSFNGGSDGDEPVVQLLNVKGTLYGVTPSGGAYNYGTVFSISTSGVERILHDFSGPADGDGEGPFGSLIDVSGTLYGTTTYGGYGNHGTVYSIKPDGTEHVLYNFQGGSDGEIPIGRLAHVNGTFYGTTDAGGTYNAGIVYAMTKTGTEHVLYNFAGGKNDGAAPYAGLTDVKGTLYGTTVIGGPKGWGTIFSVTTSGVERVLHSFGTGSYYYDGVEPYAGLTYKKGLLYGTTYAGGYHGRGTIYSVTLPGTEHVVYSFKGSPDGSEPYCDLINVKGTLYGTTQRGGTYNGGAGTVFAISSSGTEAVLHSFGYQYDGYFPYAGLTAVKGALYGTTQVGGAHGYGTVFALTP